VGAGNCVTGNWSAVLGGQGNFDGGYNFIGMYGNGLVATQAPSSYNVPSAFWADSVVTPNIPVVDSSTYSLLPDGALYTNVPTSGSGYLTRPVYVK
jgi:hypothetical protein